jgi:endonuclease YncB( thermonuclease family)
MYKTIEEFEKGRVAKGMAASLALTKGFKKLIDNYLEAKEKAYERQVSFYIKDHADVERYQQSLVDRARQNAYLYGL